MNVNPEELPAHGPVRLETLNHSQLVSFVQRALKNGRGGRQPNDAPRRAASGLAQRAVENSGQLVFARGLEPVVLARLRAERLGYQDMKAGYCIATTSCNSIVALA